MSDRRSGAHLVEVRGLSHSYGERPALRGVDFSVGYGEIYGLLGPNGGGKTTLFRVLSTLLRPTSGSIGLMGDDLLQYPQRARKRIGVVFQTPALDIRLTVRENLHHHGHLYGLSGRALSARTAEAIDRMGLGARAGDLVQALSGGLRRRTEIAKAMLHEPALLLLDEPGTGLDPAARREFLSYLQHLRGARGTTVMLATHLMEEAAACDRVAILHEGRIVVEGTPASLVESIGGDVLLVSAREPSSLARRIEERFGTGVEIVNEQIRIERRRAHAFVTALVEAFPGEIDSVTFNKPTLEDVFVHHTGHSL
jgi:ABC-2 type transport system ATP-binding protein